MNLEIAGLIFDIEGTTTPISFVHHTLFPYARQRLRSFLESHGSEMDVHRDVADLATMAGGEGREFSPDDLDAVVAYAELLMAQDRKATPLKALQGKIWRQGYRSGALHGELFDDVAPAFRRLHEAGCPLHIYSSGSIEAQRLLFEHSSAGDLTPLLSRYFDTTTGPKRDAPSYVAIADALGAVPSDLVFCTDVVAEADAATQAGLHALLLCRPGNDDPGTHDYVECDTLFDVIKHVQSIHI